MECIRCQGFMVEDHFFDFEGTHGFMWAKGWRCMNCGHAEDPVIETNRRLHEATLLGQPSEKQENEKEHVYLRAETVTRVAA
jgi:glutamate-1-semialdehyde aminotransferase